jgi:membrane protease YdiL (CAAX protease family)
MLTNRQLLLPYMAPYLAYVAIASVPGEMLSREFNYGLRLVVVAALLAWARRWYCCLTGPNSPVVSALWGIAAGVAGTALWIGLLAPFVSDAAEPWTGPAFVLRLFAAGLLVPVFEELMMRGYVFRVALQWGREREKGGQALQTALDERSLAEVGAGEWSWIAVIVSTVAFAAGHSMPEWPGAVGYGLLMCLLWVWRRDLVSCIVAHATTNIALAAYVWTSGNWQYW